MRGRKERERKEERTVLIRLRPQPPAQLLHSSPEALYDEGRTIGGAREAEMREDERIEGGWRRRRM